MSNIENKNTGGQTDPNEVPDKGSEVPKKNIEMPRNTEILTADEEEDDTETEDAESEDGESEESESEDTKSNYKIGKADSNYGRRQIKTS